MGDLVYVKRPIPAGTTYRQLRMQHQGPFEIHKKVGQGTYVVKGNKGNLWEIHHDNIYKCMMDKSITKIQEIPKTRATFPTAISTSDKQIISAWEELPGAHHNTTETEVELNTPIRRGGRVRYAPDRLKYMQIKDGQDNIPRDHYKKGYAVYNEK